VCPEHGVGSIDFLPYVRERSEGFTGREWALGAIDRWLRQDSSRYFLLTGAPGSGKTAVSAYLGALSLGLVDRAKTFRALAPGFLSAVHFCRATELRWCNPRVFAASISHQLARRFPVYADALNRSCAPLIVVNVHQSAHTVTGKQIGVIIHDASFTEEEVFARLVREPLEALTQACPDLAVTIMVDALDEARIYRGSQSGIADLLYRIGQLNPNVRFVLTSRQGQDIETQFGGAALVLSSAKHARDDRRDLERYVDRRLRHAARSRPDLTKLKRHLVSKRNFLYVKFALNLVAESGVGSPDFLRIPHGLDELIAEWLERILITTRKEWLSDYAPLLGTLLVAREALSVGQLRKIAGQEETRIRDNLAELGPLLQGDEQGYAIYHEMIGAFLDLRKIKTKGGEVANRYYLPKSEQHERIVRAYRGAAVRWAQVNFSKVDDYGLRHLAWHLAELARAEDDGKLVHELICRDLLIVKRDRFKSDLPFTEDVRLSIAVAQEQSPPDYDQVIRGFLIIAALNFFAGRVPSQAVASLAWAGKTPQAMAWATLRREPWDYIDIAKASMTHGDLSRARQAIERAIELAHSTDAIAAVASAVKILHRMGDETASSRAVTDVLARHRSHTDFVRAFGYLAEACARTGNLSAICAAIKEIPNHRLRALLRTEAAAALLDAGKKECAEIWLNKAMTEAGNDPDAALAWCSIAVVLARLGRSQTALEIARAVDAPDLGCEEHVVAELSLLHATIAKARRDRSDRIFAYAIDAAVRAGSLDDAAHEARQWPTKTARENAWLAIAREAARRGNLSIVADAVGAIEGSMRRLPAWALAGKALARVSPENFDAAAAELEKRIDSAGSESDGEAMTAALAYGFARQERPDDAIAVAEECIRMCRIQGRRRHLVQALVVIALCLATHGRAEAIKVAAEAVRIADLTELRGYDSEVQDIARTGARRVRQALRSAKATGARASRRPRGTRTKHADRDAAAELANIEALVREGNTYLLEEDGARAAENLGADAVIKAISAIVDDFSRRHTLAAITKHLIERKAWQEALAFSLARLGLEAETDGWFGVFETLEADVPVFWAIDQGRTLIKIAEVIGEIVDWWNSGPLEET
jgi:tetratricopeptide (TPR) repeat protein